MSSGDGKKDGIDPIIGKYLSKNGKKKGVKRQRTFYIDDDIYAPAHEILGSRISEFVEDCLQEMLSAADKANRNR